jgi:hypothetical protein
MIKMAKALRLSLSLSLSVCVCVCVYRSAAYNHSQYEGGTLIYILYLSQVFLIASAALEVFAALLLESML